MTDWLPTNELASRFGIDSFELLDSLAKLGLAAGPRPTPLAESHGFSSSGLNDAGRLEALWHPDVSRLLQGVGLMLLPVGSRFDQGSLFPLERGELFEEGEGPIDEDVPPVLFPSFPVEDAEEFGEVKAPARVPELARVASVADVSGAARGSGRPGSARFVVPEGVPLPGGRPSGQSAEADAPRSSQRSVGKIRPGFDRIIATDGACSGNPGPGGWAWVEQRSGERASGGAERTTNNIMELTALVRGLEFVGPEPSLLIRCDSQYVINTMTKWAPTWRRKGWKKADGQPVKNRELVERLLALYEGRTGKTEVEWVKGHAGDAANELCDELAVAESRKFAR